MLVEMTGRVSPFLGDKANKLGWMIPQETGECVSKVVMFQREHGAGN